MSSDKNDDADIDQAVLAQSDQINADDLIGGPIVVTIADVLSRGKDKTKCTIKLVERKPYNPNRNMTRIMSHAWGGGNGKQWIGKKLKLFRNPEVVFKGEVVGGIEISHMSHIATAFSLTLNSSNRKKRTFHIERLTDQDKQEPAKTEPPTIDPESIAMVKELWKSMRKRANEEATKEGWQAYVFGATARKFDALKTPEWTQDDLSKVNSAIDTDSTPPPESE